MDRKFFEHFRGRRVFLRVNVFGVRGKNHWVRKSKGRPGVDGLSVYFFDIFLRDVETRKPLSFE